MRRPNARGEPKVQTLALAPPSPAAPTKMGAQRRQPSSRRRLVGALTLLAASALALLLLASRPVPPTYGVIIDAGSTGSRVHVIAYRSTAGLPQLDWARTASMKATPGLSSFAADPRGAGLSLAPLVEFARRRVPLESWGQTEVRLMATAGLRLLDSAVAESVLQSCREVLRGSGFQFQDEWTTVISGAEEGIYAWVAANYALGTLGGDLNDTTGIIELGGASVQVTLVTSEPVPVEFSHVLKFGDVSYNLYSHSFLQLGLNVAYDSFHDLLSSPGLSSMATHLISQAKYKDPCTPRGFTRIAGSVKLPVSVLEPKVEYRPFAHAVGNFSECRSAALTLLQKGKGGLSIYNNRSIYTSCYMSPPSSVILLSLFNNRSIYTSCYMSCPSSVILHVRCTVCTVVVYWCADRLLRGRWTPPGQACVGHLDLDGDGEWASVIELSVRCR
ncbi:probable apyrase 6 isoform X4 [Miscanthus floridulus]|uniref:probable apyrase 6 isoform X4 n=1 Tax=Miscanthus floridulus TaxID=154761 RepID=UPI0034596173